MEELNEYQLGKVLLFDKPLGWTSFDVVKKVRYKLTKALNIKKLKVGHAGTLDPLATGLLIVCTGKKTKSISEIQSQSKRYEGVICLGSTTASYDLETEVEFKGDIDHLNEDTIEEALKVFTGEIEQTPPVFSAKKVNGKRAYTHARKGEMIELKKSLVTVYSFEIVRFDLPDIYFQVHCSKGTYIRSLANDLGAKLGVGGYLKELRRTDIGKHSVMDAFEIEDWQRQLTSTNIE